MDAMTSGFLTILKHAAASIGVALGLYLGLDRLWVVNHVGLLHRLGFPWSSLPVWIAVGGAIGLAGGSGWPAGCESTRRVLMRRARRQGRFGPDLEP